MESLTSYYMHECAQEKVCDMAMRIMEAKASGIDFEDIDNNGVPDTFKVDIEAILNDMDDEDIKEGMKARAPKLTGKKLKARKGKAKLMNALMKNPDIQNAIARLKAILLRTARSEASKIGVNNRIIQKSLKTGKIRI